MRKTAILLFFASMLTLFVGTGCTDKKVTSDDSIGVDSIMSDSACSDSLETLLEEEPVPKAADELFDDFIFNYAANRRLQRERTDFPVPFDNYGKQQGIDMKKWGMEHFFMHQGYYTLVFNSTAQLDIVKDTSVCNVIVEKINYSHKSVKRWHFNRVNGLWRMQKVTLMPLAKHEDAQFLNFYETFVTDTTGQQSHLAETISINAPDPDDDFSRMDGEIMPEQWSMFQPWMPSGEIYNIRYGAQVYKPSSTRIFVIRGIANGLETELTFRKESNRWLLTKMST